jgi:hypothetical protein
MRCSSHVDMVQMSTYQQRRSEDQNTRNTYVVSLLTYMSGGSVVGCGGSHSVGGDPRSSRLSPVGVFPKTRRDRVCFQRRERCEHQRRWHTQAIKRTRATTHAVTRQPHASLLSTPCLIMVRYLSPIAPITLLQE